jgi:hypothetical protein
MGLRINLLGGNFDCSEDIECCSPYNHDTTTSAASEKHTLNIQGENDTHARMSSQHSVYHQRSPMLLRDINSIDIDSILEPALFRQDLNIIPAHLPLSHATILCKRPVLEAITPLPLHAIMFVLVLIPELDCDLVVRESEQLLAQAASKYSQHQ